MYVLIRLTDADVRMACSEHVRRMGYTPINGGFILPDNASESHERFEIEVKANEVKAK